MSPNAKRAAPPTTEATRSTDPTLIEDVEIRCSDTFVCMGCPPFD
jgi:hypothetical protein